VAVESSSYEECFIEEHDEGSDEEMVFENSEAHEIENSFENMVISNR
jgi:hypothetical protein